MSDQYYVTGITINLKTFKSAQVINNKKCFIRIKTNEGLFGKTYDVGNYSHPNHAESAIEELIQAVNEYNKEKAKKQK